MNPEAMATRMSVLTRALPMRILLVDDDQLEQELITERLTAAGFAVERATNGEQALAILARQWFPLVITDWQMPVMDGIEFTQALRRRGVADTYIIMLSVRGSSLDYEHGYTSGVDDYLAKSVPDAELFARIYAAFNTLALRRSLKEAKTALEESVSIDVQSGAFAPGELNSRLHAEIRRAQRYGRKVAVVAINVRAPGEPRSIPKTAALRGVVETIGSAVRAHVDWVGRQEAATGATFVVILPETGVAESPLIKTRVFLALRRYAEAIQTPLVFDAGAAALDRTSADSAQVEAKEMFDVIGQCLGCPGRTGPEQRRAVQQSMAAHVAIVCRHGYVIDNECTLKTAKLIVPPAGAR